MKERPILFNGPMVRAILEGRKTQTRRVVKPHLNECGNFLHSGNSDLAHKHIGEWRQQNGRWFGLTGWTTLAHADCPYGQPGDRLWVRETWNWFDPDEIPGSRIGNRAPFTGVKGSREIPWVAAYAADGHLEHAHLGRALWRPSIHMPRWASRILLEVTGVRVDRLQEISEVDAIAEGVQHGRDGMFNGGPHKIKGTPRAFHTAVGAYDDLWGHINGPTSWQSNPLVWVVEFKRIDHA